MKIVTNSRKLINYTHCCAHLPSLNKMTLLFTLTPVMVFRVEDKHVIKLLRPNKHNGAKKLPKMFHIMDVWDSEET